ncbi:Gfo/Idh/MocA family oxidoreductase [Fimbriimonadia bacterium ATM]|nr:MAG: gfo/Idh/MocA family oxidoreductase [Armatimonadota bacterium]MBC6970114.1 gfo/Idh/MocA family oxidoreductase [Armatimonadota bacterium]MCE7900752.1 gfo/Idh/MocA family oxidoreductase [Armatimonadetes bacterium ATM1]MDL1928632.1 Gfo/Idh/MocA family oxidoreductase [Fimbriimonadia bacterium ATM]RIJ96224.1 MAG: dehydrogenase [Armatimonadota bacterium]
MPKSSRREFLRATAVTAIGAMVPAELLASQAESKPASPNSRIQFAVIGVGGKGWSNAESCGAHGEVVAVCDIDATTRGKGLAQYPNANTFVDFREMLEAMGDKIDAVTVSTPDHVHGVASAMAMKMGKHVYCEKPLTRTLWEARRLQQIAREKKVATQMGNQGTASADLRKVAALLKTQAFGPAREVHCWTDRAGGWWPQGVNRPESKRTPKHVAWNLWLGPSPDRDYADGYHPFAWRGWWDFGSGSLGDIGCHCMNLPFMGLDLRDPISVQAQTSGHNRDSYPAWSIVTYEFGARGSRPPLTLHWYDGGKKPPQELVPGAQYGGNGTIIVCEGATLYSPNEYGGGTQVVGGAPLPATTFEESPGHFAEWVRAIQGGRPARSNIVDYSGPLTETVLLGNLAVWADGAKVQWDAKRLKAKGTDEFDSLIHPTFRRGWSV